jgi:hypothetical protein
MKSEQVLAPTGPHVLCLDRNDVAFLQRLPSHELFQLGELASLWGQASTGIDTQTDAFRHPSGRASPSRACDAGRQTSLWSCGRRWQNWTLQEMGIYMVAIGLPVT